MIHAASPPTPSRPAISRPRSPTPSDATPNSSSVLKAATLRGWEKPEDLPGIAVFLAFETGAYITGQEPCADGGPATAT